jgi:excisionase family DNA binding protein
MRETSKAGSPPTLGTTQAAASLAVSRGTIRRWIHEGRLEGVRIGGMLRVSEEALERMIQPAGPHDE